MDKDAKIYIAGHKGLVGSSLNRTLLELGYINIIARNHDELDLTRQSDTERFFKEERPEYVFLAASKVGGIIANMTYTAEFIYNNLAIAANVINSAYLYGAKKLLNIGSSCIYPKIAPQPLKEEYLLTNILEPTNEAYAIAKIAAIKLCRYFNQQYHTNFISVMPTNLYGIRDNFNLETAHVLPALIRKFHLAKLLKNRDYDSIIKDIRTYKLGFGLDAHVDITSRASIDKALLEIGIKPEYVMLWGTGEPYREFLYVDDLSQACVFLMANYDNIALGEFINIGSGSDMKIKDIAALVKDIVAYTGDIRYDTSKPDGMQRKLMDSSRIQQLGWKQKHTLAEGIRKTYEWYVSIME
ncbi:MAG TPA: GDP-L-fucose synthase [Spirochaetota bacterium]|nr:GDP-L-fucose synthase [Spirochaetota bacterium]HPL17832.1 GDP-L-fucose synthase [Spirochaetota bacterium]HQF10611.1 GDP-L-fucose synthase [Spirochaetota bacterium]HRS79346.1 GDP-L-fucose synthase [Spirochaetota bacterium]HRT77264.1 GDP-L-fucose synthase [Spirochaetota bacterium]